MKEYKFLFRNGDTQIKVSVKANDQDSARSTITYLLNCPEKFDFTLIEVSERINPHPPHPHKEKGAFDSPFDSPFN